MSQDQTTSQGTPPASGGQDQPVDDKRSTPPNGQQEPAAGGSEPAAPAKATRPERVSEEFWDADKGELKLDALLDDRDTARTKLGELESRAAQVPQDPAGYKATIDEVKAALPKDFKLPEGMELLADDDPIMVAGKQLAHDLGVPAGEFPKLVAFHVQQQIAETKELETAAVAERAKLGEKAPQRIDAIQRWMRGTLGDAGAQALFPMLFTAPQIEAFEKLIARIGNGGAPGVSGTGREAGGSTGPDISELRGPERIRAARLIAQGKM